MSVSNSNNTSPNCLVCFSPIRCEETKHCEQFAIVFDTFCKLLRVDLIKSMQWNFEEDLIPFCESCSSAVENLKGLYDQNEVLKQQIINILNTIKHEIVSTSGSDTSGANDRVIYFRQLVVGGGSSGEDYHLVDIDSEIPYFKQEPETEAETRVNGPSALDQLGFLERMNEPCEIDDVSKQSDPLLEGPIKIESCSTTDYVADDESFPHDDLEPPMDSIFLDPDAHVSRAQDSGSIPEEIVTVTDHGLNHRCRICGKTFERKLSLDHHLKQHLDEKKIKCEKCNGEFRTMNDLTLHQKLVHLNRKSKNSDDAITVKKKCVLKLTRLSFEGKKLRKDDKTSNSCELCEKGDESSEQFSTFHSLTCYKRIHSGELKYKCDYCGIRLLCPSRLLRHRCIHTGEKPFKCDLCSKEYAQKQDLVCHKRSHTGERPLKCEYCDKGFAVPSILARHRRIHTGEKPYKCEFCFKTFRQGWTLIGHRNLHTGKKPYQCNVCNKTFTHSTSLNSHKRMHPGDAEYKCDVCNKAFLLSSTSTVLKRTYGGLKLFKCEDCE